VAAKTHHQPVNAAAAAMKGEKQRVAKLKRPASWRRHALARRRKSGAFGSFWRRHKAARWRLNGAKIPAHRKKRRSANGGRRRSFKAAKAKRNSEASGNRRKLVKAGIVVALSEK